MPRLAPYLDTITDGAPSVGSSSPARVRNNLRVRVLSETKMGGGRGGTGYLRFTRLTRSRHIFDHASPRENGALFSSCRSDFRWDERVLIFWFCLLWAVERGSWLRLHEYKMKTAQRERGANLST